MTFQFGTPPDPDKDGIMECAHYRRAVDSYDEDKGLVNNPNALHIRFTYKRMRRHLRRGRNVQILNLVKLV